MDNTTFAIINSTLLLGVGILTYSLRSYFSEKLKNIATSEDIEEITEKVEGIKVGFQKDIQETISKLSINANRQNVLFVEEKEAVFEFYSIYEKWFQSIKIVGNYPLEARTVL
jgi:hypothetical protein